MVKVLNLTLDFRVEKFNVHKSIVLRKTNALGGKNPYFFFCLFGLFFILLFCTGALLYAKKVEDNSNDE